MCMYKSERVAYEAKFSNYMEYSESLESFNAFKKRGGGSWRFWEVSGNDKVFSISMLVEEDVAVEDDYMKEWGLSDDMVHYTPQSTKNELLKAFSHRPLRIERKRDGKAPEALSF